MPRKTMWDQSKPRRLLWPPRPVVGRGFLGPAAEMRVDRWLSRRDCGGCQFCEQYKRLNKIRAAYARRRR